MRNRLNSQIIYHKSPTLCFWSSVTVNMEKSSMILSPFEQHEAEMVHNFHLTISLRPFLDKVSSSMDHHSQESPLLNTHKHTQPVKMSVEWPYIERAVMWSVVRVCKKHRLHCCKWCCKLSLSCDVCGGCFWCSTDSYSLRFVSWFTHTLSHSQRSFDSAEMCTVKDTPSHVRGDLIYWFTQFLSQQSVRVTHRLFSVL